MKKAIVSALFALVFIAAASSFAEKVNGVKEFNDNVFFKKDALHIDNTAVTTTAAELNALDGITASVDELNYLDYARRVLLTKDSTTQYVIETGTATGTQVIVYTTAFSATPQVLITPAAYVAADATNWVAVQTSPRTNFTTRALGTSTFYWLAIGQK